MVWFFYDSLDAEGKSQLFWAIKHADYTWILFSMVLGWFSHISRAIRWRYLLEPLDYHPKFWNAYHATMIGYVINLTIPRSGEVSRAGFLARYEGVPVAKSFGTIIAERVIDLLMLGLIFLIALSLRYDKIMAIINGGGSAAVSGEEKGSNLYLWIGAGVVAVGIAGLVVVLKNEKLRNRVWGMIKGFLNGVLTVFSLKKKWAFIGHTFLIWFLYVAMFAVCFQALPQTEGVALEGILAGFIAGTIGVIVTPGGLGVYPGLIALAIVEFGVSKGHGQGLGWIIWASQNLLLVVAGLISLIFMPIYNRNKENA
ncbi:flippase-like domain-containing protein [bacterium SCSIO 12741]|nr:flippase-like domain-containing protein [bacterium SCSIO 12741]